MQILQQMMIESCPCVRCQFFDPDAILAGDEKACKQGNLVIRHPHEQPVYRKSCDDFLLHDKFMFFKGESSNG